MAAWSVEVGPTGSGEGEGDLAAAARASSCCFSSRVLTAQSRCVVSYSWWVEESEASRDSSIS